MEAVPTPSRTIFIGDVHGMLDTLDQLLAELKLTATDRLIFLGDLIDKGPDPVGVIRRVAELQARGPAETHVLRGNHEDNHLRFRRNLTERPGIAQAMADSKPVLDEFFTQSSRADWNVLDNTLPFWHCPDLNILAVHGGIPKEAERLRNVQSKRNQSSSHHFGWSECEHSVFRTMRKARENTK